MKIFTKIILFGIAFGQIACGMEKNLEENPSKFLEQKINIYKKIMLCFVDGCAQLVAKNKEFDEEKLQKTLLQFGERLSAKLDKKSNNKKYNRTVESFYKDKPCLRWGYKATELFEIVLHETSEKLKSYLNNLVSNDVKSDKKNFSINDGCDGVCFYPCLETDMFARSCDSFFSPLHIAAFYGDVEKVKILLDKGADASSIGFGALEQIKFGMVTPATLVSTLLEKEIIEQDDIEQYKKILRLLERNLKKTVEKNNDENKKVN